MAHIMDARVMHSMRNSSSAASIDSSRPSGSAGSSGSSRPIRISSRRKASMSGPASSSPGGSGSSFANMSSFTALSSSLSRSSSMARRPSLSRSSSQSNNTHAAAAAAASALAAVAAQKKKKESALATPNLIDLKTISAEEVEWEGYLYKQRKIVKNWTPRYITLQNRTITVYKSKVQALGKEQHRGKWVIKQILSSLPSAGFGGSKLQPDVLGFSFLATNGNLIHFIATSSIGKAMWMHMMQLSLHRGVSPETPSMLQMAKPRPELLKTHSTDDIVALEASISKHFADKFYTELLQLLSVSKPEMWIERLPGFLRQLSKDVEILFDLETAEVSQPSCVFKGIYHGREGLVQFASLYASKYLLAMDVNEEPAHRSEDDDHHNYSCMQHALVNTVSGSTTAGKLGLQLSFTPARRVSRIVLSFRQRSSSSSSRSARRVTSNPMVLAEHATCFHQCFLSKRSLALSFSDFDVVGVLGQGGFGTVVLVKRHLSQDEYFAIKIIDKHSGAESALKERRILSGVRHPFMVCLRFAFQTQTKLYLGLDYYKGGNLYLHMHSTKMDPNVSTSSGRRFSIERARFYAAELAIALSYLHSHGIIYRDLKPDNIMLDKTGHIRLVDFGISKQLTLEGSSNGNGGNQFAPTGTLAGSPAYIAPEQLLTQKPQYGMEADWWSYGVLLYEMLTGITPFFDPNVSQMYRKIQTAEVKYDRYPPMDPVAVDLLQKLLVRDPAERIGVDEVRRHPFFEEINWAKLEAKEVEAPFIPPSEELMQNVHEHFRNMKVDESIGELGKNVNGRKATTVLNTNDESHFDEFSFAFDTNRTTFDGVSMADDGWLMRQLQEGAAMRGRLNSAGEDDIIDDSECCPVGSEDDTNHPNLYTQDSHSSEEVLSDEGEAPLFSMDTNL